MILQVAGILWQVQRGVSFRLSLNESQGSTFEIEARKRKKIFPINKYFENHDITIFLMILRLSINMLEDKRSQIANINCV